MPLPKRCSKCKSDRWNQRYLDEELAIIDRLQDELYETGLIRESGEKIEYDANEILGTKSRSIYPFDYDFISYDFLKTISPQPDIDNLWEPRKKKYFPGRRRIMNSSTKCKHRPVHEIENRLYPDYNDSLYQRMYIELKDEGRPES